MKIKQGKPALVKIMAELVDYTVMHFGMEEKEHKAIHKKLVDQVLDYQSH